MENSLNTDNKILYLNIVPRVLALPERCLSSHQTKHLTLRFEKNSTLLLPTPFKLFAVIIIFLLSIFSGVAQAENNNKTEAVFVKQLTTYTAQQAQHYSSQGFILVRQVSAISIADKKQIIPTKAPAAEVRQAEMRDEVREVKAAVTEGNILKQAEEFLNALNNYRQKNGIAPLTWDDKLGAYAKSRAELFSEQKSLDSHKGFNDFIHNQDGFNRLGFYSLGENSGYGHSTDPKSIIENSYGNSPAHDKNQLNEDWTNVGIGISGTATNFIFGGKKM